MPSKLEVIRRSLRENPEVLIVLDELQTINVKTETTEGTVHIVEFLVAPKTPTFDIDELRAFGMSLVPEVPHSACYGFWGKRDHYYIGQRVFDDINDDECQRVSLRVFPSERVAEALTNSLWSRAVISFEWLRTFNRPTPAP